MRRKLAPNRLPALCRPGAWVAAWRKIGANAVLDGRAAP